MIEEFCELLPALAQLTPGQFLILAFGLAASVCLGFPMQTRFCILSIPLRALATLVWGVSWVTMPNALVELAVN